MTCSLNSNISTPYIRREQYSEQGTCDYPFFLDPERRKDERSEHVPILPLPGSPGRRYIPGLRPAPGMMLGCSRSRTAPVLDKARC